jgi:hypothetical protein
MRRLTMGVGALAAATLLLESALLRLLAVAQFYHFAFLVISLALLGFGASGTWLGLAGRRVPSPLSAPVLPFAGAAFAAGAVLAYIAANQLPFDSYSLAWDRRQILYFVLYYLALAFPFFFSGLGIGAALAHTGGRSHIVYAANLLGSAAGALLGLILLGLAGVPAAVLASALIGLGPALAWPRWRAATAPILVVGLGGLCWLAVLNGQGSGVLGLAVSPYKGLAQAARYPGATFIFGRWNAMARADVVARAGTHLWPGLSYTYQGSLPPQDGLSLDADAFVLAQAGQDAFDR